MSNFSQKGVSLYLAIMMMSVFLTIVLGMSAILFHQLKIIRQMGNSVVAFYAADTGIERALYDENNCLLLTDTPNCGTFYPLAPCKDDINNDGYTETGANAFNLIVASSSNNISTARVGAEFTQRTEDNGAVTIPHFNIMAGYDLKNDGGETSSTFTGGGSAFTTKGADTDKASLQLGFGVDHVSDDSTVSLDLNADLRSDYDSMSGSLTFKSKF